MDLNYRGWRDEQYVQEHGFNYSDIWSNYYHMYRGNDIDFCETFDPPFDLNASPFTMVIGNLK